MTSRDTYDIEAYEAEQIAEAYFNSLYKRDIADTAAQVDGIKEQIVETYESINVTIPRVIAWFMESEECIIHNHAQRIPLTSSKLQDGDFTEPNNPSEEICA